MIENSPEGEDGNLWPGFPFSPTTPSDVSFSTVFLTALEIRQIETDPYLSVRDVTEARR